MNTRKTRLKKQRRVKGIKIRNSNQVKTFKCITPKVELNRPSELLNRPNPLLHRKPLRKNDEGSGGYGTDASPVLRSKASKSKTRRKSSSSRRGCLKR